MKRMYPIIALLCVSMFYTSSAIAGACKLGDFKTCQKEANQGDAQAQYRLAIMYNAGQGVPQSYKQATNWYSKAARQGNAKAQYNLAWMYRFGHGVHQSYKQAMQWFNKAAEQDTNGRYSLTLALYYLYTGDKNNSKRRNQGLLWFEKAADLDKSGVNARNLAQFLLASGEIGRTRKIVRLFKKAASLGDSRAQVFLGLAYLTFEKKAVDKGDKYSEMMRDELYAGITGQNKGYKLADYWLQKGMKQEKSAGLRVAIAKLYKLNGKSDKAFYWYKEAASRGDAAAQNQVGSMYELSLGVVKNIKKATHWYLKSAESGNASAQNSLGFIYESKTPDDKASKYWYAKAMAQGHPFARMKLRK